MKTVAVWGCAGFVGRACYQTFSQIKSSEWKILGYDLIKEKCPNTKEECLRADLHFVCVPTPMIKETGQCETGIVACVVEEIKKANINSWVVVKSTVTPGFTRMQNIYFDRVVFNPEFLTEINYLEDFRELSYQIIGTDNESDFYETCCLIELYEQCFVEGLMKSDHYFTTPSNEAEMIKLTRNCYLATRISFFNEIKQVCDKVDHGIDFDSMVELAGLDPRVGGHFNKVPGPDGDYGWGLSCFPKDLNNFMHLAKSYGIKPEVCMGVWNKNLEVRKNRDWETMAKAVISKF